MGRKISCDVYIWGGHAPKNIIMIPWHEVFIYEKSYLVNLDPPIVENNVNNAQLTAHSKYSEMAHFPKVIQILF